VECIQIEEAAVEYFDNVVQKDNLQVNMNIPLESELLPEYVEGWRRKIWDQGFGPILKGTNAFKKSDSFMTYEGSDLDIKRVLFRYVQNCLSQYFKFSRYCTFHMYQVVKVFLDFLLMNFCYVK